MIIAGVDEAGRGPVIGPLVVCGIAIEEGRIQELAGLGVKDSKLLTPGRRRTLAGTISRFVGRLVKIEVTPAEIDRARAEIDLNELEAQKVAGILSHLRPSKAFLDSPDPRPSLFGERVKRYLEAPPELVVENFADRKYPVVAAASILAKVERDRRIAELRRRYGDLGSGYPSDQKTVEFLRRWVQAHGDLPPFARRSWKTAQRILGEFLGR